jgi:6-pyruvoyltetrahydropterin/6-carboxytetrahydropterin synthase
LNFFQFVFSISTGCKSEFVKKQFSSTNPQLKKVLSQSERIEILISMIRVTKRFHFEMAHTLYEYDGLCRNIHGHSYNLEVTISGEPRNEPGHPKDGMLLDFSTLKEIVKTHVVNPFDHALMISSLVPEEQKQLLSQTTDRFIVVDFQPTSENLVVYIASILQPLLPSGVTLFSIRLYETETSFAEWFAADNS